MQIETNEINGFQIDKFNQHGLDEGKSQGICPLCSHDRKKENKKQKEKKKNKKKTTIIIGRRRKNKTKKKT